MAMKTRTRKTKSILRFPTPSRADLEGMEAVSAARGRYAPAEAIRRGAAITDQFTQRMLEGRVVTPLNLYEVLRVLIAKKVPFVLTGANAINSYTGRPRSTSDVDILTRPGRNHLRAVHALEQAFPELEVHAFPNVTGFFRPGEQESVIDVAMPHRKDNAESLVDTVWVDDREKGVRYRIPSLECCVANKYGAMVLVTRPAQKRLMDVADFGWMVLHSTDPGERPLDLERLRELGELVWPGGGGEEILRLVDMVKANKLIDLNTLGEQP
jgi:hypothetical protein